MHSFCHENVIHTTLKSLYKKNVKKACKNARRIHFSVHCIFFIDQHKLESKRLGAMHSFSNEDAQNDAHSTPHVVHAYMNSRFMYRPIKMGIPLAAWTTSIKNGRSKFNFNLGISRERKTIPTVADVATVPSSLTSSTVLCRKSWIPICEVAHTSTI